MKMTRNAIYTYVVNALHEAKPNMYCTSVYEPILKESPSAYIAEITTPENPRYVTLASDDEQRISTFEVQITSNLVNKASSEANDLMDIVDKAFKKMHYIRIMREPIPQKDSSVRIISRYRRNIGGGDLMPNE